MLPAVGPAQRRDAADRTALSARSTGLGAAPARPGRGQRADDLRRLRPDVGARRARRPRHGSPLAHGDAHVADAGPRLLRPQLALLDRDRRQHGAAHDDRGARERAPRVAADDREGAARDQPAPGRARCIADAAAAALPVQQPAEHLGVDAARSGDRRTDADQARRSAASLAGERRQRGDDAGHRNGADARLPRRRGDALRRSAVVHDRRRARHGGRAGADLPPPADRRERAPTRARRHPAARAPADPEPPRGRPPGADRARQRRRRRRWRLAGGVRDRARRDARAPGGPLSGSPCVRDTGAARGRHRSPHHAAVPSRADGGRPACPHARCGY